MYAVRNPSIHEYEKITLALKIATSTSYSVTDFLSHPFKKLLLDAQTKVEIICHRENVPSFALPTIVLNTNLSIRN